jgi:hypothetical protein
MLKRVTLSTAAAVMAGIICLSAASTANASGEDGSVDITNPSAGTYDGRWDGEATKETKHSKKASTTRSRVKKIVVDRLLPKRESMAFVVMCREAQETENRTCVWGPKKGKRPSVAEATLDLDGIARLLVARIRLPDPRPLVGPDPAVNEWKMVAVGYPLWLWTAGPGVVTDRVRAFGVSFILRARWVSTRFEMGDGHTVLCSRMRPYRSGVRPGSRSPDCGYVYGRASLPGGSFTVRATTSWRVSWSALGMSGSVPASFSGSRVLPVGELNALVVR